MLLHCIKVFQLFSTIILLFSSFPESYSKKFFYIYEWDESMNDVWPKNGTKLHSKSGYNHDFNHNYGCGKLLDAKVGLFQTWQFSLYKVVMARLRVSEHRTR